MQGTISKKLYNKQPYIFSRQSLKKCKGSWQFRTIKNLKNPFMPVKITLPFFSDGIQLKDHLS
jgi:hypothetical protein